MIDRFRLTGAVPPAHQRRIDEINRRCGIVDEQGQPRPAGPPPPVNLLTIHQTTGTTRIVFRRVPYNVPPLGYTHGVTVYYLRWQFKRALIDSQGSDREQVRAALRDLLTLCQTLVALYRQLVRPVRRRDRVRWWWSRFNPFAKIELEEVDALADFFYTCTTRSNVTRVHAALPGMPVDLTSPTALRTSPPPIRHGVMRTASRARGRFT